MKCACSVRPYAPMPGDHHEPECPAHVAEPPVQACRLGGEVLGLKTLREAFANGDVWRVSFSLETGERVRLVRTHRGWVYDGEPG